MPPRLLLSAIILQHIPHCWYFFPTTVLTPRESSTLVSSTFYLISVDALAPKNRNTLGISLKKV